MPLQLSGLSECDSHQAQRPNGPDPISSFLHGCLWRGEAASIAQRRFDRVLDRRENDSVFNSGQRDLAVFVVLVQNVIAALIKGDGGRFWAPESLQQDVDQG